jgi:hypothetical protein
MNAMVAYLFRMPAGIAGDVNRAQPATVITEVITPFGSTGAPNAYGIPVVLDVTTHQVRMLAAADTIAMVYGLLARPFPTQGVVGMTDPVGGGLPPTEGACNVMVRGYMSVKLSGSTAAVKGQPAYAWTAAASGSHIVGGFESTNPGASGIALSATFRGPADANGITEVAFNI